jgi:hypothetical protein
MLKAPRGGKSKKAKTEHNTQLAQKMKDLTPEIQAIRKSYAQRIADAAREMLAANTKAEELEKEMIEKMEALAGKEFQKFHTVSFQPHGCGMEEQFDHFGEMHGPGFDDVNDMAQDMIEIAEQVLAAAEIKKNEDE